MDVNDYVTEAKRQLNDPRNYKVFAKDPTTTKGAYIEYVQVGFTILSKNIS